MKLEKKYIEKSKHYIININDFILNKIIKQKFFRNSWIFLN